MKGQGAHHNLSFEDHEFSQQMSWKCHEIRLNRPVYQCPVSLADLDQKKCISEEFPQAVDSLIFIEISFYISHNKKLKVQN